MKIIFTAIVLFSIISFVPVSEECINKDFGGVECTYNSSYLDFQIGPDGSLWLCRITWYDCVDTISGETYYDSFRECYLESGEQEDCPNGAICPIEFGAPE